MSPSPPSLRAGKWLGAGGGSSLEEVGSEKGKGPPRRLPSSLLSGAWESRGGNAQRSSPKGFLAPAGAIVPWRNLLQEARPALKSVQLSLSPAGELSLGRSCSGGICFVFAGLRFTESSRRRRPPPCPLPSPGLAPAGVTSGEARYPEPCHRRVPGDCHRSPGCGAGGCTWMGLSPRLSPEPSSHGAP